MQRTRRRATTKLHIETGAVAGARTTSIAPSARPAPISKAAAGQSAAPRLRPSYPVRAPSPGCGRIAAGTPMPKANRPLPMCPSSATTCHTTVYLPRERGVRLQRCAYFRRMVGRAQARDPRRRRQGHAASRAIFLRRHQAQRHDAGACWTSAPDAGVLPSKRACALSRAETSARPDARTKSANRVGRRMIRRPSPDGPSAVPARALLDAGVELIEDGGKSSTMLWSWISADECADDTPGSTTRTHRSYRAGAGVRSPAHAAGNRRAVSAARAAAARRCRLR